MHAHTYSVCLDLWTNQQGKLTGQNFVHVVQFFYTAYFQNNYTREIKANYIQSDIKSIGTARRKSNKNSSFFQKKTTPGESESEDESKKISLSGLITLKEFKAQISDNYIWRCIAISPSSLTAPQRPVSMMYAAPPVPDIPTLPPATPLNTRNNDTPPTSPRGNPVATPTDPMRPSSPRSPSTSSPLPPPPDTSETATSPTQWHRIKPRSPPATVRSGDGIDNNVSSPERKEGGEDGDNKKEGEEWVPWKLTDLQPRGATTTATTTTTTTNETGESSIVSRGDESGWGGLLTAEEEARLEQELHDMIAKATNSLLQEEATAIEELTGILEPKQAEGSIEEVKEKEKEEEEDLLDTETDIESYINEMESKLKALVLQTAADL